MSRIGKKIIWSYLIIVMLTVLISMSIIRADFEKNLNERIRRDLASDAMNISAQIEEDRVFFQNLYNYDIEADVRDLFPSDAASNTLSDLHQPIYLLPTRTKSSSTRHGKTMTEIS